MSDTWRWDPPYESPYRTSIDVIERAEPREVPLGARRVAFGFSRALEAETLAGLQEFDRRRSADGWGEHAAMVAGLDREGLAV
ncbi:MAG TPA: hypothetical protein VN609_11020 [Propionibacteriaceae bacterium]|nr:hypothetical protein [Propionibacteriaceae bacterium]